MDGAFDALCTHLERGHEKLGRLEKKMDRDRLTNGTLTADKENNLEESRKAYEALLTNVTSLASSLNRYEREIVPCCFWKITALLLTEHGTDSIVVM